MSPNNLRTSGPVLQLDALYEDKVQLQRIFYGFIALLLLGLVAGVFIVLTTNNIANAWVVGLSILPVLASLYFVQHYQFEPAAAFLAFVLITAITLTATNGLGIHHLSVFGYPAILIVASLVIRTRTMVLILAYNILCVVWLVFGELTGAYTPGVLVRSVPGDFLTVALILTLTAMMVRQLSGALFRSAIRLKSELGERKRLEEKYRKIFDNAIEGIFQSTPAGRFLSVNPAMARMYGYDSPDEMLESITDIATQIYAYPNERADLARRLENGEKIQNLEFLDRRKDGSTFWTSMNAQAILDEHGAILYYEGTLEDITPRKQADATSRQNEARYRNLFNGIPDGVYRSTPEGRFVDINPAMAKMFGYASRAEMLKVDIKKDLFFNPEDRKSDYLAPGEERVDTFRMKRRDGSEIWVEDHGHYIHDDYGNINFHEGILRDVTPRIEAETKRTQAEQTLQQFRSIMDDSNDAIFFLAPATGRYKYFNRRACTLLGYEPEELSEVVVTDVATHVTDLEVWLQRVEQVRTQRGLIFETCYRRKDRSTFPVEVSARVLEYADGETVVAFVRDITERKNAEQEREKLIGELKAKNDELSQFTYTVSHDLKSPLVTINGFLGYLEKDALAGNQVRVKQDAQRIQEAVNKMHNLLTELLELSRIGRMMNTSETIRFEDLVNDARELLHARLTSANITVRTHPNLPAVHGDRQRLTEVLQNLLDNAAKYMGTQTTPQIEIGQYGTDAETNQLIFFVKDNGIGIAPEYHERIFGLFNKLDPKSEGTGIGLTLVKKIVEVHGGRLWVESEAGKGATFYFTLPGASASH